MCRLPSTLLAWKCVRSSELVAAACLVVLRFAELPYAVTIEVTTYTTQTSSHSSVGLRKETTVS
jgi:hypothetical protein